jgi:hypothetical protein
MVAQQFIDAYKTAYISLKNNPGGRENLFKKIRTNRRVAQGGAAVRQLGHKSDLLPPQERDHAGQEARARRG